VDSAARAPGRTVDYICWTREQAWLRVRAAAVRRTQIKPDSPVRRKNSRPRTCRRCSDCCGVFSRCRRRRDAAAETPREPKRDFGSYL